MYRLINGIFQNLLLNPWKRGLKLDLKCSIDCVWSFLLLIDVFVILNNFEYRCHYRLGFHWNLNFENSQFVNKGCLF